MAVVGRSRQPAQALVEAAVSVAVIAALLAFVLTVAWWAHAQNVLTTAVQDGARVASAYDGDPERGLAAARALLRAGLGDSAGRVELRAREDAASVTVAARGAWPVLVGPGVEVAFPLGAEARVRKERWQP